MRIARPTGSLHLWLIPALILMTLSCSDSNCVDCVGECETFVFVLQDDYGESRPPDLREHYWYFELGWEGWEFIGEWEQGVGSPLPGWLSEVRNARRCLLDGDGCPCSEFCAGDLASTPRENREAEEAALYFSGELVASDSAYYLLLGHFSDIRDELGDQVAELRDTPFQLPWSSQALIVTLTESASQRFEAGEFTDLDSLNALFGVTKMQKMSGAPKLHLWFEGRYNPYRLAEFYESEACVEYSGPIMYARSPSEWGNLIPWVTR
jgi:hypothetical protein